MPCRIYAKQQHGLNWNVPLDQPNRLACGTRRAPQKNTPLSRAGVGPVEPLKVAPRQNPLPDDLG